ncbi:DUF3221 domain-containing protein [Paenibacillus lupini]|uniref:DUF3221 domain-containing protein n=1 Tax=Paenibacillus lupini TaxID=1450204 RepID=UPI001420A50E|nr:DUF3221 domain-containing protein [Paenibacillus lupini]NIK21679.1 hypothetical protein [Paenibacillus lupini]
MNRILLILIIALIGTLLGCSKQPDKGDYIIGKEYESNIPKIYVVHHITDKEARTKSLHDFLVNDDENDVVLYHVNDIKLYNDLDIGERVTVKPGGYTMLSYPPQAVAEEIIRYSKRN